MPLSVISFLFLYNIMVPQKYNDKNKIPINDSDFDINFDDFNFEGTTEKDNIFDNLMNEELNKFRIPSHFDIIDDSNFDDFDDFNFGNTIENNNFKIPSQFNIINPTNMLISENQKPNMIDTKNLKSVIFHKYFSKEFICNSINSSDKILPCDYSKYESSDKIILPTSTLNIFATSSRDNLYVLRILNPKNSKYVFVGVADFFSPERVMYSPKWIMDYISAENGDKIYVDAISVPQVSYAKFKMPPEIDKILTNITDKSRVSSLNIKAVLEFILTNHCLLFLGKKIQAKIFEKIWEFEVIALKPVNIGSITNVDLQIDIV